MDYLHPGHCGNTKRYWSKTSRNKLINMIMCDAIFCGVKWLSFSYAPDNSLRLDSCFSAWQRHMSRLPPALLYQHEALWHLSWNLQPCRTELFSVYTCLFFFLAVCSCAGSSLPLALWICWCLIRWCVVCCWLWRLRWVGWVCTCHLLCCSLSGPAANRLWKITSQSVGDSWVYSKNLVTSNMLSMNLSRYWSKASTHSAGKQCLQLHSATACREIVPSEPITASGMNRV